MIYILETIARQFSEEKKQSKITESDYFALYKGLKVQFTFVLGVNFKLKFR